jgi:hypothetical protein
LPTIGKRNYVSYKVKEKFREFMEEKDEDKIVLQVRQAMFQLDTIKVQVENLKMFMKDDRE